MEMLGVEKGIIRSRSLTHCAPIQNPWDNDDNVRWVLFE